MATEEMIDTVDDFSGEDIDLNLQTYADFGVVFQFNIGRQGDIDLNPQTFADFGAVFQFNIGKQRGIDLNLQT